MGTRMTFEFVQPVLVRDGDHIPVPTEAQIAELESGLKALKADLADAMESLRSASKEEATELRQRIAALRAECANQTAVIARSRRFAQAFKDEAVLCKFRMHRFSFNERKAAEDEATDLGDDLVPRIDQAKLTLNLLAACIESWDLPDSLLDSCGIEKGEPITPETVGKLPAPMVSTLASVLRWRSEPSEGRLSFLA